MSAAPNPAVVLLIGFVYCGSRILVDQLALLAYPWCDHPTKCYDYAEELAASMDHSVDPCDNLYEHVCAHWSRRYPAFPGQFHFLKIRATVFVLQQLERAAPQHPSLAVRRAVTGYQACRGAFDNQREDAQVLFDVFDQFNVTWPASTLPENFDVMEYLLGLSLDYGLETPLLLRLSPYLPTDRRYGFSLDFVLGRDGTAYEPAQVAACMPSVAPSVGHNSALQFGEIIHAVHSDLVVLLDAVSRDRTRVLATIENLANDVAQQVAPDTLLNAINKHLPKNTPVQKDEKVLVYNKTGFALSEMLRTANRSRYAHLVLFSGWNIVARNNAGMSSSLLTCMSGKASEDARVLAAGICLHFVNEMAGYALARFYVDSAELSRAVLDVTDTWNAVRDATRRNFPTLSWMDKSTAAGAMDHVDSLLSIVAVPAHLNTSQALDAFYDYLGADQSQPFFQWFMKSRNRRSDKYKSFIREDPKVAVHREDMPLSSVDVNAFYLHLYHIMVVLPAIIAPPFAAPGVAPAVIYGSIGKVLGHELSHAFDPQSSTQTRTGDFATWWSLPSFKRFVDRLLCVISQLGNYTESYVHGFNALSEVFADTAGTEKARLAYASLPIQPGMLGYSQEQLFFVAGCFEFCAKNPYSWDVSDIYPASALRCNLPVANEKKFAAAFNCPTGAALNPQTRCIFHGT
ncbi:neprilysin-1-like [Dermacentor andersoni]|uniref:neprilysin-1-like n=1 Tax=Dermacentor andersoni TaxID=34620 RepID=UPI002416B853|nr:neprilysin-1-like [Dermacentor andersoni]